MIYDITVTQILVNPTGTSILGSRYAIINLNAKKKSKLYIILVGTIFLLA